MTNFLKTSDKEKSLKESRMDSGKEEVGEEWTFVQRSKTRVTRDFTSANMQIRRKQNGMFKVLKEGVKKTVNIEFDVQ